MAFVTVSGWVMPYALFGAPPPRPTTHAATCVGGGCHEAVTARSNLHAPVAQGKCHVCHVLSEPRQHTFQDAVPREKLCVACHVLQLRDVVHQPVAIGDCTACHDPHGSDHRLLLRADPAAGLCQTCHDPTTFAQRRHVHGPVAVGACVLCHEAHSSWHGRLLSRPPADTCSACHADVHEAIQSRRHVHDAARDGRCLDCHDAHASDQPAQLRDPPVLLCTGCHEPIRRGLLRDAVVHGAATNDDSCAACHLGHASDLPRLQRRPQPEACLACHDRPLPDAAGRMLADMAALLRDNPFHHGPIREGNCTACHDPHAGPRFRLLTADYPPDFYAPFDLSRYQLCFTCHRPEMVTSEAGRGVTNFRDGDRNLHQVHVNREKGRTCRACHEVHASRRPFHMAEGVPFGAERWMLEINFSATATGGSCAPGCHKPATYDRGPTDAAPATLPTGVAP